MADDEAKKAKQAEIERKRAEVRKRMEEASKAKKAKKGFMTPERKKKLRVSGAELAVIFSYRTNGFISHENSCCCVRKPPKNWRKNRSVKQRNVGASSRSDAASPRTSKMPTKVLLIMSPILKKKPVAIFLAIIRKTRTPKK